MGLSKYKGCGSEISDQAKTYPSCGTPIKKSLSFKTKIILVAAVVVVIAAIITAIVVSNANAWENVFEVKEIDYVTGSDYYGDAWIYMHEYVDFDDYTLYEITNVSNETVEHVYAVIEVPVVSTGDDLIFEDLISSSIAPGETVEYTISNSDIDKAADEANNNWPFRGSGEIVKIRWE